MKKSIFLSALVLLGLGLMTSVSAQKKKGSKGGKKKATTEAKAPDAPAATTPAAPTAPAAATADVPFEDSGVATPDIVAEADSFDFSVVALDTTKPKDGYMKLTNLKGAKPFPMPEENKYSVKPYKRIWREIDLVDTENRVLCAPDDQLIKFMMAAVKAGKLIAYDDEGFKKKISYGEAMKRFKDKVVVTDKQDTLTGEVLSTKEMWAEFNPDSVTKFTIKEDIYFDRIRGRVATRIVGIAPVKKQKATNGTVLFETRPFWFNFDKCRNLLASKEIVDLSRGISDMSYDDFFIQRAFKSTIVKQSNAADMWIKDIYPEKDKQVREAARIEREIARYKRNIWRYN